MTIALNSLRNIAVRTATVGFLLLLGVLTARLLGPEGRGVFALVTLYSSISVAFLGGMGTAAGHYISNQRRPVPEVVANVAALALLAGTGALACSLAVYWVVGLSSAFSPWWLVIVGAAQPGLLLGAALTWAFLGADDHTNYSYAILAPSLFSLLLVGPALALFPHSTRAALVAWVLAQYVVVGWLWWRGRGVWSPLPLGAVSPASLSALVGFSVMSGLANVISILNRYVDTLATDRFLGTAQVGVYAVAVQLVEGLFFISQAVGIAIWARVGSASREEAANLTARSIRYSLALMAAGGAVLFAVSGFAIPLLYGEDFAGAVTPFRIFVPGVVAWGMANLLAAYYTNQLGRPRVPLAIAALSLAIALVLCVVLIPTVGLAGGAIATTVSYTTAILVELELFRRQTGISRRELLLVDAADLRDALRTAVAVLAAARRAATGQPPPSPPATPDPPPADEATGGPLFRRVR